MRPLRLTAGDILQVDVTVRNTGLITIRSQEPISGFMYDEGETFPVAEVPGRFRVGVDYRNRTQTKDHPYRWGWSGDLAPGGMITVTGFIRLNAIGTRDYWAGLVQEGVGWLHDNAGRTFITVVPPTTATTTPTATTTATPTPTATATVTPTQKAQLQLPGWLPASLYWLTSAPAAVDTAALANQSQGRISFTIVLELKKGGQ